MKRALAGLVAVVVALWAGLGVWWVTRDDTTAEEPPASTSIAPNDVEDTRPIVTVQGGDTGPETPSPPLAISLGDGASSDSGQAPALAVVNGTPIAPDEVATMFEGLAPLADPEPSDDGFERPAETLPPPLVGATVQAPFPPLGEGDIPATPEAPPLQVVRFQPEGEVALAPFLSVTFNQPMVPITTLAQLDVADVPIEVTPAIDGRWRWIGTRTLRFEVVPGDLDRLPAATEYQVIVPAGTESAAGSTLADAVSWTFSTPSPTVTSFVGNDQTTGLEPVFVAVFDQRVDPDAVLAITSLVADGDEVAVRRASEEEIAADVAASNAVTAALDARAVAFRPVEPLPPNADFAVEIGPGTPSAEGPRTTNLASTYEGRTFGSLEITATRCNGGGDCEPGTPFTIEFSNALDPDAFDADMITIEPPIPGLEVNVYGNVIELFGATVGRTTYVVTLDGTLQDVFGQTLGDAADVDFRVGSARPTLQGLDRDWITLDPSADRPHVTVTTVNHDSVRARAWRVSPVDLVAFRAYQESWYSDADAPIPDWPLVMDSVLEIDGTQDQYVETEVDLSDAFAEAGSQIVVRIDPTREYSENDDDYWRNRPTIAWVQSTDLAIDAFVDHKQLVIWTTDLATGEPVDGVPVELIGDGRVATTDDDGVATLELSDTGIVGLYANAGDRTAFLPAQWYEGWRAQAQSDESRWYIFDDRGVYRPGETARITGWVRQFARSSDAQLALYDSSTTVTYQASDAQGNELASGTTDLNPLGGFNVSIELPDGANLGPAYIEFQLPGESNAFGNHSFSVQEFRRPEFEVTASNESPGPFYASGSATVRVDAEYYSGGPLPGADVDWLVSTRDTTYSPPNWDDFTFGIWRPWWNFGGDVFGGDVFGGAIGGDTASEPCFDCGPGFDTEYQQFSGVTDASGSHYLDVGFGGDEVDLPKSVTAEATVYDLNRQGWAARTDVLVHASTYYVGLQTDRAFVLQGTPIRVDGVVTDVDGATVPDREVSVTAGRVEWVRSDGQWNEQLADEQTCSFTSSGDPADGSMRCEFTTEVGGQYRITALVTDDEGRNNRTELTQWVSGGEGRPSRNVERDLVTIVPDLEFYAPGDTAELLVQAPFSPAHGLVTVIRNGIESTERFDAEDGSAVVEVPIDDAFIPNVTIQVDMVGSAPRTDDDGNAVPDAPGRPAFASGQINLSIPPTSRALDVSAIPAADAVEPGAGTSVTVTVTDAAGTPVGGADVAIVVVDEAVLALTGYELTDPLDVFYQNISANLTSEYTRSSVLLARAERFLGNRASADSPDSADAGSEMSSESSDTVAESTAAGGDGVSVAVRSNFDALAVYAPDESTDDAGQATVDVALPDTLTRYRVMAVAIDGADHFGKGESTITARLPLQVRPSAPRFLNFGDRFELPVIVQNQTDEDMEVAVGIEAANLVLTGAVGQTVTVPANNRVEVRFPATTDAVGTARFRVMASSGDSVDAAEVALPVYTPATAEAFATYGVIDEGVIAQPTLAPTDVYPQFGGLEINTSSTALQALTDAVLYLADYRYDSADSLASRVMAIATLRDVLEAFDAEGLPSPDELNAAVQRDLDELAALQNDDGGFPYWQRGRQSIPYVSIQTTHALVLAQQAGYDVQADTLSRALAHLASIEESFPLDYGESIRNTLSAYALFVRGEAGQPDNGKATSLYDRVGDDLELDALAWVWPSISEPGRRSTIEQRFLNAAVDTAGAATFATSYGEDAYVIANSDRRTDGVILDALIAQAPDSELIPKVVAGLLAGQTKGRWNNAQENAFILIAMNRYFGTFESVTPDFVARAWLGELYASEAAFQGRSTDRVTTVVPMPELIAAGDSTIVLAKEGVGRLYYRLGVRYAPADLSLAARDDGFVVDRIYEAVDDPGDVSQDTDGNWVIKAGASVRVRLTMVADARRTHVALVDPLPAGLEPVNPALALSTTIPPPDEGDDEGDDTIAAESGPASRPSFWGWNWFEHQNLRDDRAEAFASVLPGGTYEYSYIARATTPGVFVVPPARAEEMYAPETFGRSASTTVTIT
ncbi:MAG: alpha-2-macroglobulin family protein [Ilumatobacteraceae bacterium]